MPKRFIEGAGDAPRTRGTAQRFGVALMTPRVKDADEARRTLRKHGHSADCWTGTKKTRRQQRTLKPKGGRDADSPYGVGP